MSISNLQSTRTTTTDTSATNNWSASNEAAHNPSTPGNTQAENQHVDALREQLQHEAQQDPAAFRSALRTAFGDKASPVQIDQLLDLALADKLPMPASVRFVDADSLGAGALGAYDSAHGGTLFLDRSLLDDDPLFLQSVFNEEMGHHFDALLGGTDAAGDEGAVFAQTLDEGSLSQDTLSALKSENDHGLIQVDGRLIQVEFMEDGTGAEDSGESEGSNDSGECSSDSSGDSSGETSESNESSGDTGGDDSGQTASEAGGECSVGNDPGTEEPDEQDDGDRHKNGDSEMDKQGPSKRGDPLGGGDKDPGDDKEAGDGKDVGNTDLGNAADQDKAKSLTDTVANSADAAKENLERSPDMQSDSTGLRGAFARAADAFGRVFGGIGTAIGFSKGYDRERDRGGSKADAVREGFREVALDFDDGVISGAGLTGGALLGGAIGTGVTAGPVGTAVGATAGGLLGAETANQLYNDSWVDAGIDLGVNYAFDTIENWQHRE